MPQPTTLVTLLLTGLASTACSVYAPMQGAAPNLRRQGELEATVAWSCTDRLDLAVAYSPLPHVLVRGGASAKGSRPDSPHDSSTYARVRQYELALGTYWPLGPHWTVGALAGFGQLYPSSHYEGDGDFRLFSQPRPLHVFDGSYYKYTGEAYVNVQPDPGTCLGFSYRLTQLHLSSVTNQGQPVPAAPIWRGEPTLLLRVCPRPAVGVVWLYLALGASLTYGYDPTTAYDENDPARQFKLGQSYLLLGVAVKPLLRRPRPAPVAP